MNIEHLMEGGTTCEDRGYVTCANGDCAPYAEDCGLGNQPNQNPQTCEEKGYAGTCFDGTCYNYPDECPGG